MSEGARGCDLLVWLVTEVVTDDSKSARVSVCSLHRAEGRTIKVKKKQLLLSCKVLWYIQLLLVHDFSCLPVYFCFRLPVSYLLQIWF